MSSSFSQSALVRFSRGMLQKFFQISLLRESISAAWASVTVPLAVVYILCSFLRTSFLNADVLSKSTKNYTFEHYLSRGENGFFSDALKVKFFFAEPL